MVRALRRWLVGPPLDARPAQRGTLAHVEALAVTALALGWAGTLATLVAVVLRLRGMEERLARLETQAWAEDGRVLH